MTAQRFDLVAIGNAIVDILAYAEDSFLLAHGAQKGAMQLVDEARAETLFAAMGPTTVVSGGSAANTAVGAAALGARVAFIGKVRADELGRLYAHDLAASGVTFDVPPAPDGAATARSFVLVTPDGERSMSTYLGASQALGPADVDEAVIRDAGTVYLEGYLWDPPAAKEAFRKAVAVAHGAGRSVALSLSDAFCVGRYRHEFRALMADGSVDLLFANEGELTSLYETATFDEAVTQLRAAGLDAAVTRSAAGALVIAGGTVSTVPAEPVAAVVDTTGAGDLFAAGFLAGRARGLAPASCARLGAIAAAEIIGHLGARPQAKLADLAREAGLGG